MRQLGIVFVLWAMVTATAQAADADNAAAALAELERLCRAVVRGRRRCTASQEAKQ